MEAKKLMASPHRFIILFVVIAFAFLLLPLSQIFPLYYSGQDSPRLPDQEKVKKVLQAIEEIEKAQIDGSRSVRRSLTLSESELNAYIAYRIITDPLELIRELELRLLDNNRFEGKAVFDLSQENLPHFIPPKATLFFAASFRVEGGRIYFTFRQIFLGAQELSVDFVSEMIKALAIAHNEPPEGLNRSFELPFGIKDIKSKKGFAIFYY